MVPLGSRTLESLLPAIETACSRHSFVVAITSWEPVPDVALLPFLLHTYWADRVQHLRLNATFTLFPYPPAAQRLTMEPLVDPEEAVFARYVARFDRNAQSRDQEGDFVHPDWEEGYQRHKTDLPKRMLPARAFLAVDQVRPDGTVELGHRPVLGRFVTRGSRYARALRPTVRIAPRSFTSSAITALVDVDLVIADAQGQRGSRGLEQTRRLLAARDTQRPTILVASSPSDLIPLQLNETAHPPQQIELGTCPDLPIVRICDVERQRPQTEETFRFAVLELRGTDPEVDRVIPLAVAAWWRAHQRLGGPIDSDPAYRRLVGALEELRQTHPDLAAGLSPVVALLQEVAEDEARVRSRLTAVETTIDRHLNDDHLSSVTVSLRDKESADVLSEHLAKAWKVRTQEIADLGVNITAARVVTADQSDALVINGYYGASTIDDVVRSGCRFATLILDPLESQAMHRGLEAMLSVLADAASMRALVSSLIEAVQPHIPSHWAGSVEVGLGLYGGPVTDPGDLHPTSSADTQGKLIIHFTDGTYELASPFHRFDVLAPLGTAVTSTAASELQPGDEVILTTSGGFSERLLEALDQGLLREHAQKRLTWLQLARAVVDVGRVSVAALHRRLRNDGVSVDLQTVRGWVRGPEGSNTVPDQWQHFKALAGALDMDLDETVLRDLYTSVRLLRVRHRQAGRDLVRAMRAAATSRLTAASLKRIESSWGLTVRELVSATRLAVVDEVDT